MADLEHRGRDTSTVNELLRELAELRELDRRRQAHPPGSAAYDASTVEVDRRGQRLMDRFRDLEQRRDGIDQADHAHDGAGNPGRLHLNGTQGVDARQPLTRDGASRLN